MKIRIFAVLLALMPGLVWGATPSKGRVGVAGGAKTMMSAKKRAGTSDKVKTTKATTKKQVVEEDEEEYEDDEEETTTKKSSEKTSGDCREEYRQCMDDFCLMDESEGDRCSCSDNIKHSKKLIQEIQKIQQEAEKQMTEGVEKKKLGAKAKIIFGESEKAKRSSRASGIDFTAWISGSDEESLAADEDIGDALYEMAADSCKDILEKCGAKKGEMEEKLYQREVVKDCKTFDSYLAEQKREAEANKRTADAAVRAAQLEMFDTTEKYNRGECLLAYKACVADKGGCGTQFENCLDADLLARRSNACENILDQCMSVSKYVKQDWEAESQTILKEAAKYADKNMRLTCLAKIQYCLEDGCSTSTNTACLTDVNVAAGVCPIITECEEKIPGIQGAINDKLAVLRTKFCANDVDKCLRDKCGKNFTAPECLGKNAAEIAKLCPQDMFASCKTEQQFDIIVQSTLLQMDYQMLQGCLNYYGEQLGRVCGTDMACLPKSDIVLGLDKLPKNENDLVKLRSRVRAESAAKVEEFFKQFDTDKTVDACKSAEQPANSGQDGLQSTVFNTARMLAEINAENRFLSELEMKVVELSRAASVEEAKKNCESVYKVEPKPKVADNNDRKHKDKENKSYSYIKSVSFEPQMRNCHVCRMQRVCETGGEKKATSALKAGFGAMSAGASAGTMVQPGWGTLIGGVVGGVGGAIGGAMSGGREDFCQEIESCEDINM